jgi:peptidoglycan/xylan/chitin deacetylase (PgdA/CDA1 family)
MYHSIGNVPAGTDIFNLHVGPERFREQIEFLASYYEILPLTWLYHCARSGRPAPNALALTFDDGYANNLTVAAPILQEFQAPATLFLSTGFLGRDAYWWDRLAQIVLTATHYPSKLVHIEPSFLGAERVLNENLDLHKWSAQESKLGPLRELVLELWGGLRHLSLDRIYGLLGELDSLFAPNVDLTGARPLRIDEVRLAADVFTIGAHTVTHPFLTAVDNQRLNAEISESRSMCRTLSGQVVDCFSYPFGNVDARVAAEVAPHMSLACTVQEGVVGSDTDPLWIPRIQISAWTPDELNSKLDDVMRQSEWQQ